MKKILLMNNTLNGINLFRSGLIENLKKNYKIKLVADQGNEENKKKCEFLNVSIDRRGVNPLKDLILFFNYIKILKKENPDLVTQYTIKPNIYGSLACSLLKISYINTINGCGSVFLKENYLGKLVRFMYKISLKNSKKVFFQNRDDMNEFLLKQIVKPNQCTYVPGSGVDLKKFNVVSKQINNDKIVFLFIGRLIKEKGIDLFCQTAEKIKKKYPNVEFQVLGPINREDKDTFSYKKLKNFEEKKILKYLGVSSDVRNEIKNVDCILFPSYYREGVPRSLLEAGAMGKAIITTNSVGCKDTVVDEETGYLVKVNNLDSIIEKIEKYINLSESEKMKLGENSRLKIEKEFDEQKVFRVYNKIIKEILGEI